MLFNLNWHSGYHLPTPKQSCQKTHPVAVEKMSLHFRRVKLLTCTKQINQRGDCWNCLVHYYVKPGCGESSSEWKKYGQKTILNGFGDSNRRKKNREKNSMLCLIVKVRAFPYTLCNESSRDCEWTAVWP